VYNTTFIRWTTHSPPGLSALDVELAAICDGLAKDFGEIVEDLNQGDKSCSLGRQLADTVASGAGDCCVPKPKANAETQ
jgi:4a-hydroxytetrahydrobiopterin dehydratase